MTTAVQELPEVGEIVVATVTKIMDQGAYVNLMNIIMFKDFYTYQKLQLADQACRKVSQDWRKKSPLVKRVNTANLKLIYH